MRMEVIWLMEALIRPMALALSSVVSGAQREPGAGRRGASDVLHALGEPLLQAFLPFAAAHLSSILYALLKAAILR